MDQGRQRTHGTVGKMRKKPLRLRNSLGSGTREHMRQGMVTDFGEEPKGRAKKGTQITISLTSKK